MLLLKSPLKPNRPSSRRQPLRWLTAEEPPGKRPPRTGTVPQEAKIYQGPETSCDTSVASVRRLRAGAFPSRDAAAGRADARPPVAPGAEAVWKAT